MAAWSGLLRSTGQILLRGSQFLPKNLKQNVEGTIQKRFMSGHDRVMVIKSSTWQWDKTKDYLHMYTLIGVIPCFLVIMYTTIFIGPAQLSPIPEGYEPKEWEYHRDPISRFIARYILPNPQMHYEQYLHFVWTESEIRKLRMLDAKVKNLIKERHDYAAYYYLPYHGGKYTRRAAYYEKETMERARGV